MAAAHGLVVHCSATTHTLWRLSPHSQGFPFLDVSHETDRHACWEALTVCVLSPAEALSSVNAAVMYQTASCPTLPWAAGVIKESCCIRTHHTI